MLALHVSRPIQHSPADVVIDTVHLSEKPEIRVHLKPRRVLLESRMKCLFRSTFHLVAARTIPGLKCITCASRLSSIIGNSQPFPPSEEDSCAGSKLLSGRSNRGNVPYPSLWLSYLALCPFGNTCSRLPILSVFIAIYAAS